jgi:predicted  nucleic acid-binding Zn-ribbon protein
LFEIELNSQHHEVNDQANEFEESLKNFEENFGSMKSNKEYKDLQSNLKTIREMISQANDSNVELHRQMTTIIDHLKVLNSPLDQLEKNLPVISELDGR